MAPLADTDPRRDAGDQRTRGGSVPAGHENRTVVDFAASEPTAISPVTFDAPPSHEEIAAEAYAIYESRGGDHGRHDDDWLEAERRLRARRSDDTSKR